MKMQAVPFYPSASGGRRDAALATRPTLKQWQNRLFRQIRSNSEASFTPAENINSRRTAAEVSIHTLCQFADRHGAIAVCIRDWAIADETVCRADGVA